MRAYGLDRGMALDRSIGCCARRTAQSRRNAISIFTRIRRDDREPASTRAVRARPETEVAASFTRTQWGEQNILSALQRL
jgi:hypothetical protein